MSVRANIAGVAVGADQPVRLMAVINVSPESFYRGSVRADAAALKEAASRFEDEGADFIDVGAMSTAPYLDGEISLEEELRRMTWALEVLAGVARVPLSADTRRPEVAEAALACGARILNDVGGLRGDRRMGEVAARAGGLVLMASEIGLPPVVKSAPPMEIVRAALTRSLERADAAGIARERVLIDPGVGFFTRQATNALDFNRALLADLRQLDAFAQPVLVGVSRKSFIGKLTGKMEPSERLFGSLAAAAIAVCNGASVIRTHDVAATRDAVRVAEALRPPR